MPRRLPLVLLAVTFLVGVASLAAFANPWHLVALQPAARHPLTLWALCWVLAGGTLLAWRPPWRVAVALAVLALPVAYVSGFTAWLDAETARPEVARWRTPDGRHDVRVVQSDTFDPTWEVRVRTRAGLLSREDVVWQGREAGAPPSVTFSGPRTVEIVDENGRYAVTF